MKIVLDTNVLVSGVFFSPDILDEYRRVGMALAVRHPALAAALEPVLALLAMNASIVDAPPLAEPVSEDSADDKFLAAAIAFRPRSLALCTNERTLLSVVVPISPGRDFGSRFRTAALRRVQQIPVPAALRLEMTGAFTDICLQRTRSRAVLGSMNQLGFGAQVWLRERPVGNLEELGRWLCDTPCSALETHWPWKEVTAGATSAGWGQLSR